MHDYFLTKLGNSGYIAHLISHGDGRFVQITRVAGTAELFLKLITVFLFYCPKTMRILFDKFVCNFQHKSHILPYNESYFNILKAPKGVIIFRRNLMISVIVLGERPTLLPI